MGQLEQGSGRPRPSLPHSALLLKLATKVYILIWLLRLINKVQLSKY